MMGQTIRRLKMTRRPCNAWHCLLISLLFMPTMVHADDWPQWLGPQRDGVWHETGILRIFPEKGPHVRWRQTISSGYAGPAVVGGRVYVTDRVAQKGNPATEQVDHYARRPGPVSSAYCACVNPTAKSSGNTSTTVPIQRPTLQDHAPRLRCTRARSTPWVQRAISSAWLRIRVR